MRNIVSRDSSNEAMLWRYEVTATLHNQDARDQYLAWLHAGHVSAVCAWAERAEVVSVIMPEASDDSQISFAVKSVYWFESEERFREYERDGAPALRAEGVELSRRIGGVGFERSFGWSRAVKS